MTADENAIAALGRNNCRVSSNQAISVASLAEDRSTSRPEIAKYRLRPSMQIGGIATCPTLACSNTI
jgi:hypothetical protein